MNGRTRPYRRHLKSLSEGTMMVINTQKLHVGENPINAHLKDVSGWNSASKIQNAHNLTTRILWDFVPVNKLVESCLLSTHPTNEADEEVSQRIR